MYIMNPAERISNICARPQAPGGRFNLLFWNLLAPSVFKLLGRWSLFVVDFVCALLASVLSGKHALRWVFVDLSLENLVYLLTGAGYNRPAVVSRWRIDDCGRLGAISSSQNEVDRIRAWKSDKVCSEEQAEHGSEEEERSDQHMAEQSLFLLDQGVLARGEMDHPGRNHRNWQEAGPVVASSQHCCRPAFVDV